jgi:hypothetical protein
VIALHGERAWICGPAGEQPPVHAGVDRGQSERVCREALGQPDRHAALRFLAHALPSLDTSLPGLVNEGLLSLHELSTGARRRADWERAGDRARAVIGRSGDELLRGLGFEAERLDSLTHVLRAAGRRTALAVLLDRAEAPELSSPRFSNLSPVSYALAKADGENFDWVILLQGNRIRIYPTAVGIGVGRRGRTETWVELQASMLKDADAAYLWLLCSAEALGEKGSLRELLESSGRFAGDLADRLRDRIYERVVPQLARAIVQARGLKAPSANDLALTYEMALTVLFRLLFIAYAEDRDLLPYRFNDAYRRRSLKQKALEYVELAVKGDGTLASGDGHWREAQALFEAVDKGNREWGVPPYNGGLFSIDPAVSPAGAALAKLSLPNDAFQPALRDLLLIETPEGPLGPVDFRSLGVREFGTIYEGLLESELSVAEVDLAVNRKGEYIPAVGAKGKTLTVDVPAGTVYLHDKSGARKSSGSYFTKSFAVEHLLDGALEPALADHLARLDKLDETDAAEAFFDFRIADIAMGSGHFLVAAVDRIERRLAQALARRPLGGVARRLGELRRAARTHLGPLADQFEIEDGPVLRRLIARRCVYGVDLNPLSVQLARLSLWIHTFVPGLPLSLLDHNLVEGNSLVGVGTVDEIEEKFRDAGMVLFPVDAKSLLGSAEAPLQRLAAIADATPADIERGRSAMAEARKAVADTRALCDIIAALPIAATDAPIEFQFENWEKLRPMVRQSRALQQAHDALDGLRPLHFPIAFPEVFLRARRPGFDVILGNPPWQEATVEEHAFWARHFPGLRGHDQPTQERLKTKYRRERPDLVTAWEAEAAEAERLRRALTGGGFPGMGTGDPDLYKAFCWRFWTLAARDGGRIGVVLPRSALAAKGSTAFRLAIFEAARSIEATLLANSRQWVFSGVDTRYTFALTNIERGPDGGGAIRFRGPYTSLQAFRAGMKRPLPSFSAAEIQSWTDSAALPLLPSDESIDVFAQLRKAPRLDLNDGKSWRARPDAELHATAQKPLMDLKSKDCPDGFWPVYKGESFDLWEADSGAYYAWADPIQVLPFLQAKRLKSSKRRNGDSAHAEFAPAHVRDPSTLPCQGARIAFRDITNRTNQRTVITCLLPPKVFITNAAPYLLWPRGDELDQAFLLGVLASLPLDWYARRFVETHVNFFVLNPFPIPRPPRADARWKRVVALAGRLACPDARFATWAEAVGVKHGKLGDDDKQDMIRELDAVVAHLYGLTEKQLVHVFESFHEGWDHADRLAATLEHFRAWAKHA